MERTEWLKRIKPGDTVTRMLGGDIPIDLKVSEVTEDVIICGKHGWKFDRTLGVEVDEDLGWGPPPKLTGSFLRQPKGEE